MKAFHFSFLVVLSLSVCTSLAFCEPWYFEVKENSTDGITLRELSPTMRYQGYPVLNPIFYHKIRNRKFVKANELTAGTILEIDEKDLAAAKQYYYQYNMQGFEHASRGFVTGIKILYAPQMNINDVKKLNEKEIYISLQSLVQNSFLLKLKPVPPLVPVSENRVKEIQIQDLFERFTAEESLPAFYYLNTLKVQKADDPKLPEIYKQLHDLTASMSKLIEDGLQKEVLVSEAKLNQEQSSSDDSTEPEFEEDSEMGTGGKSFDLDEGELYEVMRLRKVLGNIHAIGGEEMKPLLDLLDSIPQGIPVQEGEKFELSSGYKWRGKKFHVGFDYAGDMHTPLVSTANGTVIYAGKEGAYGNILKIQMEDLPIQIWYAHIANGGFLVDVNDQVEKGQKIAKMGNTGRVKGRTGIHVHYEVRILDTVTGNYLPINPAEFVK